MIALLPCPFCGGEAVEGQIGDDWHPPHPDQGGHYIQCSDPMCGASTNLRFACGDDPKPPLAQQWNRRTALAPTHERLARVARAICCPGGCKSIPGATVCVAYQVEDVARGAILALGGEE